MEDERDFSVIEEILDSGMEACEMWEAFIDEGFDIEDVEHYLFNY